MIDNWGVRYYPGEPPRKKDSGTNQNRGLKIEVDDRTAGMQQNGRSSGANAP